LHSFSYLFRVCPGGWHRGVVSKQKPRDWLAIAGFFPEIWFWSSEDSTHVAKRSGAAMPNPDLSGLTLLHARLRCKRGCHFLITMTKHHFTRFVKK